MKKVIIAIIIAGILFCALAGCERAENGPSSVSLTDAKEQGSETVATEEKTVTDEPTVTETVTTEAKTPVDEPVVWEDTIVNAKFLNMYCGIYHDINLNQDLNDLIVSYLKGGDWVNALPLLDCEYEFYFENKLVKYSESGTFVDVTDSITLKLADEQKEALNKKLEAKTNEYTKYNSVVEEMVKNLDTSNVKVEFVDSGYDGKVYYFTPYEFTLTPADWADVIDTFKHAEWHKGVYDMIADFKIYIDSWVLEYSIDGVVNDSNGRSALISQGCVDIINSILLPKTVQLRTEGDKMIVFREYTGYGYFAGVATKVILPNDRAYEITSSLKDLKETGETVKAINDKDLDFYREHAEYEFPMDEGTLWIETKDGLYRLDGNRTQLCRVDTYFGEGRVLEFPDDLKKMTLRLYYRYPYTYYYGTYNSNTGEIQLEQIFTLYPDVVPQFFEIKELKIDKTLHGNNSITLELSTEWWGQMKVELESAASDDNLSYGDSKIVEMKGTFEPTVVELNFGGFPFDYYIYITLDEVNVKIELRIIV